MGSLVARSAWDNPSVACGNSKNERTAELTADCNLYGPLNISDADKSYADDVAATRDGGDEAAYVRPSYNLAHRQYYNLQKKTEMNLEIDSIVTLMTWRRRAEAAYVRPSYNLAHRQYYNLQKKTEMNLEIDSINDKCAAAADIHIDSGRPLRRRINLAALAWNRVPLSNALRSTTILLSRNASKIPARAKIEARSRPSRLPARRRARSPRRDTDAAHTAREFPRITT
ncbi:hypothetical protein ACJJTC_018567 [Scirpophaga incertulas]